MDGGLTAWRHPRPRGAAGRCVGRTDLRVDPRKAKRLAHRIRAALRRRGTPRGVVVTSPLARCAAVGRVLARWGCRHRVDARLAELDFGAWDGRRWDAIGEAAVAAWTDAFADHRPGGGECVAALLARCADFLADPDPADAVVAHAGWIAAAHWLAAHGGAPPTAERWPAPIGYGRPFVLVRPQGQEAPWNVSPSRSTTVWPRNSTPG